MSSLKVYINLQTPFVEIDGTETKKTLAKYLSELLLTEQSGDALKYQGWGVDLRTSGIIEIDKSDFQTLYDVVKSTQRWTATMKAQVMLIMLDAEKKPARPVDIPDSGK